MSRHKHIFGVAATLVAATLLFGALWGFDWLEGGWKTHFFTSESTDYIKDLYTTAYHAAHDDNPLVCHAMNYPQGEHYTYSGLQPWIAMPLQLLHAMGVHNVERAVLPLMNLWIILGVILCALFLYLLLRRLQLPVWYCVGSALVITLLSPQLQRMGGHISLSYYCVIPMLLYFSLCHMQTMQPGWAAAFGATAFLFGLAHPYYYVFFAVVALFELAWSAWRCHRKELPWRQLALSALLLFLLPTILFVAATSAGIPEGVRNPVPKGYYDYMASIEGLMLPFSKWYFGNHSRLFGTVEWEGCSYIGLVADAVAFALLLSALRALFFRRHRKAFLATGNHELNVLLVASVALLIYAFGVPLRWLPRNFATYLPSFLLQIRALARLEWLFCYVIAVAASYMLFQWWQQDKQRIRTALFVLAIAIASVEAVAGNLKNKDWYGFNRWEEWVDYDNRLPQNQWMQHFDADRYQAILCMPGFNIGSELTDRHPVPDLYKQCAVISVRTGLPQICNYNSRGVLRQAWDRVALTLAPWNGFDLARQLPDNRPLLVVASNDTNQISKTEKALLHEASAITTTAAATIYELPVSAFLTVSRKTQDDLHRRLAHSRTDGFTSAADTAADVHQKITLVDCDLLDAGQQELSFWMTPILTPQYGQCQWWLTLGGHGLPDLTSAGCQLADSLIAVDTRLDKGLLRFRFNVPQGYSHIHFELRNRYMKPSQALFHHIMLRPSDSDVATKMGDTLLLNNIPVSTNGTSPAPGFVSIDGDRFAIDGNPWFPLMLNYKAFIHGDRVAPASWYTGGDIRSHFDTIAAWGFNAVRVCLDALDPQPDTATMFAATRRMVMQADSAGLRVMLLIKPPFEGYWHDYAAGLMRRLADLPALWAYDLMNEPLYFDPADDRDKLDAVHEVQKWRKMVRLNAPHQLFTLSTAEPIEVFEWDPSMLPVDFVCMHTYHPLRVQAEMWWYSHYCGKPWMVGETGLPADGDSIPYAAQLQFLKETYSYARTVGTAGYGWWEFQDYPEGVNFEAQFTGLRDRHGHRKPAAKLVQSLALSKKPATPGIATRPPANYYNMLAYGNLAVSGKVVDSEGRPIVGAVVRGWNEDWSVGINTYSDNNGGFRLVSNDVCSHFEVSAPGYSKVKLDRHLPYPARLTLPLRDREYQRIPLLGWGDNGSVLPLSDDGRFQARHAVATSLGTISLSPCHPFTQ